MGAEVKLFGMQKQIRNVLFLTLPAYQKEGKGSTLAAQGNQGGTDTIWTRVGIFDTMGQKRRKVPSKSLIQGMCGA